MARTNSLGKTGVVVKIQSAAIAKDGTITVRATIVDSDGIPLDRLGVATNGPVSMSFIAAYIPAGQTQYVSYTTTVAKRHSEQQPLADPGGQRFRRHFHHQRHRRLHLYLQDQGAGHLRPHRDARHRRLRPTQPRRVRHIRRMERDLQRRLQFRSQRLAGEGDALGGDHRRLQPVPRPADRPRRIPPEGGTLHHVPHAADHQPGYRSSPRI